MATDDFGYHPPITTSPSHPDPSLWIGLFTIQNPDPLSPSINESLIDRKATRLFRRRGSLTYTKTPPKDSDKNDSKTKNAVKPEQKEADKEASKQGRNDRDGALDDWSASSVDTAAEKYREELKTMREELETLRRKFVEKDQLLKSAEASKGQSSVQSQVDELKHSADEKDSLIKTIQLQLDDAKLKLADKEAYVKKLEWEAMTSNQKVERLQEELNSMQSEISSFLLLFEGLSKEFPATPSEDHEVKPLCLDCLHDIDDTEEMEMQKMVEATQGYIAAIAIAKEKQDEASLAAAAQARLHLQSFVFGTDV